MKKFVFQMQLLLLAMLLTIPGKSNASSSLMNNGYDSLSISNDTCIANFFYYSLGNGSYIFYDSLSFYGDDATVLWTIGDSTYSNVHYITHTFPQGITVASVCLSITTADSNTCTDCRSFNIQQDTSTYCNANFSYAFSDSAFEGFKRVYFTNTSTSSDPIVSSEWNFGDGEHTNEMNPYHDYYDSSDSLWVAGLFITTSSGCTDSVFRNVYIPGTTDTTIYPCNADFIYEIINSDSAYEGFTRVKFTNTSISSNPIILFEWQFADGGYSNDMHPVHDYYLVNDTVLAVHLSIITSSGCMDTVIQNVYIPVMTDTTITSCQADFSYTKVITDSVSTGYIRLQFNSYSEEPIVFSNWHFGDGGYSTDLNPTHDYAVSQNTFYANLSIITESGCMDTVYHTVYLPIGLDTSCVADFTYELTSIDTAGKVYPEVNFYNNSTGPFLNYVWTFGDGWSVGEKNPVHRYNYSQDTTVLVQLFVYNGGCTDTKSREISLPATFEVFSLSGIVTGKNELLPQGSIVLYKKADNGYFEIKDAEVVNDGNFAFDGLREGKYLLYAMPHMYYTGQYLPTYYVNKLQWFRADAIDLKSNTGDVTLELITTRFLGTGPGRISGTINWNSNTNKSTTNMKSAKFESAVLVYLLTESGTVLDACAPDEFNNFAFNDLPYGTYSLMLESVNLPENKTTVTLSPEIRSVDAIEFNIDGYMVGITDITSKNDFKVYSVSDEEIGIQINQGGSYKVAVIDLSGMSIFETTEDFNASVEKIISIGSIPTGIYLIRLENDTSVLTQKLRK